MNRSLRPFVLISVFLFSLFQVLPATAQQTVFTRADTLRGSMNAERRFDVLRYEISVTPVYADRSLSGSNRITYIDSGLYTLQIDLQEPLVIDSIIKDGRSLTFRREGNAFHVALRDSAIKFKACLSCRNVMTVYYHGNPQVAARPPWDGGWIFVRDSLGRQWMSVACEGTGASVWFPCKDYLGDEPDSGASIAITVPDSLIAVANGRLQSKKSNGNGSTQYTWAVKSPINNYDIIPYIGHYSSWTKEYGGEKGRLDCSYYVLDYNLAKAKKHFAGVDSMLHAFEHWFGPYPFYEDGYKLVEAPHLGMEHQSDVAYGNHYMEGYLGRDLSGSGWGMKWDFIVVHESGHEWFGNNITAKDIADEWIHESFTSFSETLYTDYWFGRAAGDAYNMGVRKNIENKFPVVQYYGVNAGPQGTDEYYKGANLLQTIREAMGSDTAFRKVLRGLNKELYHQTITRETLISTFNRLAGKDFTPVFDQYQLDTRIPVLEYKMNKKNLEFRWTNCRPEFNLPVRISGPKTYWLYPTTQWQSKKAAALPMVIDPRFYVESKNLGTAGAVKVN